MAEVKEVVQGSSARLYKRFSKKKDGYWNVHEGQFDAIKITPARDVKIIGFGMYEPNENY